MRTEVTVVIADPQRLAAFRDDLHLVGRVLRFSSSNLASVLESIRANQPQLVAIDAAFAGTVPGEAFVERVEQLQIPASEIQLVARVNGAWAIQPRPGYAVAPRVVDMKSTGLNTRRTPRFLVLDPLQAVVESAGKAGLVDMSVMGAQVMSEPILRPNQKIRVALPDANQTLRVTAHVAWAVFENPHYAPQAYYRAGMEFTDAAQQALEDYCRRHCSEDPIPQRAERVSGCASR